MARSSHPPLVVRVPASTSNLGPGFDLLGLALSLFLEVTLEGTGDTDRWSELSGETRGWPDAEDNLVFRAIDRVHVERGVRRPALTLRATSEIPLGRGLGSSGAAVAAGLLLGDALTGATLARDELVRLGCELEGHPDNSTASLLGGCALAAPCDGGVTVVRQPIHPSIAFAVAWPASPVPTREGRRALPAEVAFADAVENPRRLALLLEGLRTGDPGLLALGGEDRLHVPHRIALIEGGAAALTAAKGAGASLATISGSGSALIALGTHERAAEIAEAMRAELERRDPPAAARVLAPVFSAPAVTSLAKPS